LASTAACTVYYPHTIVIQIIGDKVVALCRKLGRTTADVKTKVMLLLLMREKLHSLCWTLGLVHLAGT
jgi:hypothetical protein